MQVREWAWAFCKSAGVCLRRFESCTCHVCDVSRHHGRPNPIVVGSAVLGLAGGAGWSAGALVALGWVERQLADELSGDGVDDADVEVLDQDEDAGSGVGSSDADGVELTAVAQGDLAGLVDLRSWRIRSWVSSVRSPGVALGRLV